jgi:hypothetical protein
MIYLLVMVIEWLFMVILMVIYGDFPWNVMGIYPLVMTNNQRVTG